MLPKESANRSSFGIHGKTPSSSYFEKILRITYYYGRVSNSAFAAGNKSLRFNPIAKANAPAT